MELNLLLAHYFFRLKQRNECQNTTKVQMIDLTQSSEVGLRLSFYREEAKMKYSSILKNIDLLRWAKNREIRCREIQDSEIVLLETKTGQQPRYKCTCRAVCNDRVTAMITARGRYWAMRCADLCKRNITFQAYQQHYHPSQEFQFEQIIVFSLISQLLL